VSREPRPTRGEYVVWRTVTTRWADDDVYGHMNNATYFELIDTAVNAHLIEATGVDIRRLPAIGVVAEVSCRYFHEVTFPAPVDLGLAVERLGGSSVVYRVGIVQGGAGSATDQVSAEGRFVHVYVANTDTPAPGADPAARDGATGRRPVVPVPEQIRAVLEPLVRTDR
jgi:acyl-CoA thioesterase FadM